VGRGGEKKVGERPPLRKMAGVWHGLAINQGQTKARVAHRDYEGAKNGFSCLVPYGDWKGGDVLLWEVCKRIELREGEALFFRGSAIQNDNWNIEEGGVRNCIDLFIHENVVRMDKERRGGYGRRDKAGSGPGQAGRQPWALKRPGDEVLSGAEKKRRRRANDQGADPNGDIDDIAE